MHPIARDLVFDIGLHNGDDSAYYLHLGYRVVGLEANPLLTAQCTQRFEKEIGQGRMTVVNAGVLKQAGTFTFYRNLVNDE
jgi:FkbM family methyltransferase